MRIFFSVGEPSGDQHAAHLIAELRRRVPAVEVVGLGGPLMEAAGCRLLYRMTDLAIMGIFRVIPMLLAFWRLYRLAKKSLDEARPDAVVLIDFPGFNWHIARAAKKRGIRVFYYMPPQLWAWAPWRIRKVRKNVDHVLSGLTFERDWYVARGVDAVFVGHPFFDEVAEHRLDEQFLRGRRTSRSTIPIDRTAVDEAEATADTSRSTVRNVGVLPGSRHLEVTRNGPALMAIVGKLATRHPDARFRIACYKEEHRALLRQMACQSEAEAQIEFCVGKTPEIIELSDCCLMVSGSVSLEVLARRTPAVVVYKGGPLAAAMAKWVLTCKFISLPNLLANRMVMPEHFYSGDDADAISEITATLDGWLSDDDALEAKRQEMASLANLTATTGATARTVDAVLERLGVASTTRVAA